MAGFQGRSDNMVKLRGININHAEFEDFLFAMAAVNEFVWRTQTEDFWVKFKVFGFVPLTILFAISQTPLMLKHELKGEDAEKAPEHL